MRCSGPAFVLLAFLSAFVGSVRAQSSVDILEQELKAAREENTQMSAQLLANFFSQVDNAMGSPDAAVSLYQNAGGAMPTGAPVVTQHDSETPTERQARQALDQAALSRLGILLQLHCGLMHYAAKFSTDPKNDSLQDEFNSWLKKAAPLYCQLGSMDPAASANNGGGPGGDQSSDFPHKHHRDRGEEGGGGGNGGGLGGGGNGGTPPVPHLSLSELKNKSVRDSIISKSLGFKGWGEGEGSSWSVHDIPRLYRTKILEPSRAKPTVDTLSYWDVYITMANADEKDADKWTTTVYPPLQFARACDDYAIDPNTSKLEGLIKLAKVNTAFPGSKDWLNQIEGMIKDYDAKHSTKTAQNTVPTATPIDSNVTVSSHQEGDATIITTHTNNTANPAPPPGH